MLYNEVVSELDTKVRLYNAYVLPVLLSSAEIWTFTGTLEKKSEALHPQCLRRLLCVRYNEHMTNANVLR